MRHVDQQRFDEISLLLRLRRIIRLNSGPLHRPNKKADGIKHGANRRVIERHLLIDASALIVTKLWEEFFPHVTRGDTKADDANLGEFISIPRFWRNYSRNDPGHRRIIKARIRRLTRGSQRRPISKSLND